MKSRLSSKIQSETVEKRGNEYRYKLLRDTLRIIESDTIYIPYGVKVADNGKDKSFLPRFGELARAVFFIVTGAVVIGVASWMAKKAGKSTPTYKP